uniref:Uncharacterized protein n=1 Tax=Romanomermis culicivorax TaxID=13658 RepID=A0A915IKU5_ROMCU
MQQITVALVNCGYQSLAVSTGGAFGYGKVTSHKKNHPECKQGYFNDFLVVEDFNREEFNRRSHFTRKIIVRLGDYPGNLLVQINYRSNPSPEKRKYKVENNYQIDKSYCSNTILHYFHTACTKRDEIAPEQ